MTLKRCMTITITSTCSININISNNSSSRCSQGNMVKKSHTWTSLPKLPMLPSVTQCIHTKTSINISLSTLFITNISITTYQALSLLMQTSSIISTSHHLISTLMRMMMTLAKEDINNSNNIIIRRSDEFR